MMSAACVAASGGGCWLAVFAYKAVDAGATVASSAYAFHQYYEQGTASDADLAIALTDILASLLPGVGEMSGVTALVWDIADPFINDEQRWPPAVAR